jgi:hypothetical protein
LDDAVGLGNMRAGDIGSVVGRARVSVGRELRERGIDLYLVRVMRPVRRVLRRSGLMAELGEDHL